MNRLCCVPALLTLAVIGRADVSSGPKAGVTQSPLSQE